MLMSPSSREFFERNWMWNSRGPANLIIVLLRVSLNRSIRWPNSQAHRPFLRAGNSPVPGSDPGIREGAEEYERRSTYANDLFLSRQRKAARFTWPWLRRKRRLASWDITTTSARPPNLPNTVVRPCIRLTRAHGAHPTRRSGCGPNVPPNSR